MLKPVGSVFDKLNQELERRTLMFAIRVVVILSFNYYEMASV
ncbi:hypothetical protein [Salipaludibacillus agaradhaerens]|nr:hypothetical protein [Salipaludibacillus agaradhaerens]